MVRNEYNLVRHELIGLKVKILDSKNKSLKKIKGIVVDETYNTIIIEKKNKKRKIVPKKSTIFLFELDNNKKVKVLGDILIGRPEDRIKKKFPKWKYR
ncbi:MAG: ribonuclease P protein subunit [Candidatus Aenigmarchaeota archaeon]|nr:ribonuclease P protein subunit [Candidatus Aenigmarchaeota archaeon]